MKRVLLLMAALTLIAVTGCSAGNQPASTAPASSSAKSWQDDVTAVIVSRFESEGVHVASIDVTSTWPPTHPLSWTATATVDATPTGSQRVFRLTGEDGVAGVAVESTASVR